MVSIKKYKKKSKKTRKKRGGKLFDGIKKLLIAGRGGVARAACHFLKEKRPGTWKMGIVDEGEQCARGQESSSGGRPVPYSEDAEAQRNKNASSRLYRELVENVKSFIISIHSYQHQELDRRARESHPNLKMTDASYNAAFTEELWKECLYMVKDGAVHDDAQEFRKTRNALINRAFKCAHAQGDLDKYAYLTFFSAEEFDPYDSTVTSASYKNFLCKIAVADREYIHKNIATLYPGAKAIAYYYYGKNCKKECECSDKKNERHHNLARSLLITKIKQTTMLKKTAKCFGETKLLNEDEEMEAAFKAKDEEERRKRFATVTKEDILTSVKEQVDKKKNVLKIVATKDDRAWMKGQGRGKINKLLGDNYDFENSLTYGGDIDIWLEEANTNSNFKNWCEDFFQPITVVLDPYIPLLWVTLTEVANSIHADEKEFPKGISRKRQIAVQSRADVASAEWEEVENEKFFENLFKYIADELSYEVEFATAALAVGLQQQKPEEFKQLRPRVQTYIEKAEVDPEWVREEPFALLKEINFVRVKEAVGDKYLDERDRAFARGVVTKIETIISNKMKREPAAAAADLVSGWYRELLSHHCPRRRKAARVRRRALWEAAEARAIAAVADKVGEGVGKDKRDADGDVFFDALDSIEGGRRRGVPLRRSTRVHRRKKKNKKHKTRKKRGVRRRRSRKTHKKRRILRKKTRRRRKYKGGFDWLDKILGRQKQSKGRGPKGVDLEEMQKRARQERENIERLKEIAAMSTGKSIPISLLLEQFSIQCDMENVEGSNRASKGFHKALKLIAQELTKLSTSEHHNIENMNDGEICNFVKKQLKNLKVPHKKKGRTESKAFRKKSRPIAMIALILLIIAASSAPAVSASGVRGSQLQHHTSMTKAERAAVALPPGQSPWRFGELGDDLFKRDPSLAEGNMGYARSDMPQIENLAQMDQLKEIAKKNGYTTSREEINLREMKILRPIQDEVHAGKVQDLCDLGFTEGRLPSHLVPIILVCGSDGCWILDGHHRVHAELGCAIDPKAVVLIISGQENGEKMVKKIFADMPSEWFAGHTMWGDAPKAHHRTHADLWGKSTT